MDVYSSSKKIVLLTLHIELECSDHESAIICWKGVYIQTHKHVNIYTISTPTIYLLTWKFTRPLNCSLDIIHINLYTCEIIIRIKRSSNVDIDDNIY